MKRKLFMLFTALTVFMILCVQSLAAEEPLTLEIRGGEAWVVECDRMTACGRVEVPAEYLGVPVVGIDDFAFYFCENVTEVSLPETVREIGEWGFARCFSLEKINIPQNAELGLGAFLGCPL